MCALVHILSVAVVKQNRFQLFGEGKLLPVRPLWVYLAFSFGVPAAYVLASAYARDLCVVQVFG